MGVWIKFFLSWKRELDNPNYDIDLLAMNNGDPDGTHVDKAEPCRDHSEGDNKITAEYNSNNEAEDETRVVKDSDADLGNDNSCPNNINIIELKEL